MNILGFDPSLTSSGYAYTVDGSVCTGRIRPQSLRGLERLRFIRHAFHEVLDLSRPDLIVYEDYALGARGRVFHIAELGGVLKLVAKDRGVDILLVPPATLKMFATGKGNAKKPEIVQVVADRWGYRVGNDDEADAFVLLRIGEGFIGKSRIRKARSIEALKKCTLVRA